MTKAAELAKMGEVLTNSQLGGRRNMIINGAMQVAQRGTSQASITSTGYYTIDRWQVAITNGGTWTMSQDTDVPTGEGFANSLKMDCTTADTSFGASDSLYVRTKLESQDCQNMKKGTSNAEKVTLRFWVKSSKTGTHIVELLDNDNSRFVSLAYTISSADTWENHTLTFPADTTRSPALPVPCNLTITRPFSATIGCESLLPACAFIKNAGDLDITPNTAFESSSLHFVISAFPPSITTSPTSVSQSAS